MCFGRCGVNGGPRVPLSKGGFGKINLELTRALADKSLWRLFWGSLGWFAGDFLFIYFFLPGPISIPYLCIYSGPKLAQSWTFWSLGPDCAAWIFWKVAFDLDRQTPSSRSTDFVPKKKKKCSSTPRCSLILNRSMVCWLDLFPTHDKKKNQKKSKLGKFGGTFAEKKQTSFFLSSLLYDIGNKIKNNISFLTSKVAPFWLVIGSRPKKLTSSSTCRPMKSACPERS